MLPTNTKQPTIVQPGGEVVIATPVVPAPAYPQQRAPPTPLLTARGASQSQFYYADPHGFRPNPHAQAIAVGTPVTQAQASSAPVAAATLVSSATPQAVPVQAMAEVTADYSSGNPPRSTTADRVSFVPGGNPALVTHANYFWNDIHTISPASLSRFPNLIRLTLRGNHLVQLNGLEACPNLRWLDVRTGP